MENRETFIYFLIYIFIFIAICEIPIELKGKKYIITLSDITYRPRLSSEGFWPVHCFNFFILLSILHPSLSYIYVINVIELQSNKRCFFGERFIYRKIISAVGIDTISRVRIFAPFNILSLWDYCLFQPPKLTKKYTHGLI